MKTNIDEMVEKFLQWKLPQDFAPDCYVRFEHPGNGVSWPIGTNLLTYTQAKNMFEHCLEKTEEFVCIKSLRQVTSPAPTTRPLAPEEAEMMRTLGVTGKCVRVLAFNDRPKPKPEVGEREALISRAAESIAALNGRIMEPFYCSIDQDAIRVLIDCVDVLEPEQFDETKNDSAITQSMLDRCWLSFEAMKNELLKLSTALNHQINLHIECGDREQYLIKKVKHLEELLEIQNLKINLMGSGQAINADD